MKKVSIHLTPEQAYAAGLVARTQCDMAITLFWIGLLSIYGYKASGIMAPRITPGPKDSFHIEYQTSWDTSQQLSQHDTIDKLLHPKA